MQADIAEKVDAAKRRKKNPDKGFASKIFGYFSRRPKSTFFPWQSKKSERRKNRFYKNYQRMRPYQAIGAEGAAQPRRLVRSAAGAAKATLQNS